MVWVVSLSSWIALALRRVLTPLGLALALAAGVVPSVQAQGVELPTIAARRQDGGVVLDVVANIALGKAVEDALRRGVPAYFIAEATVYRPRWYWRDEKVARVARSWRLSYQPLTSAWRVSLGGFSQSYGSLEEALTTITRLAHWKIAEAGAVDADEKYYVEFTYRLDASQLPRPMQLDLAAQADWHIAVERTVKVD
jgi:hypothetical protein